MKPEAAISTSRDGQRGLTLAELMVAMTIVLVAVAGALSLYDATWDSFKKGENAAEQQQGLRIAFEKIGVDLQMAGFNFNPDGDSGRPDEQIEAAFDTAIIIRADFDTELESALAGGAFETVSTGNDEIVAYVLAKPDGTSSGEMTFEADLREVPRDGSVEELDIPQVAMVQDDPPYTLYRITLNENSLLWGTEDFIQREVLAENVGSMQFRYFDTGGNLLNSSFNLGTTADDIGGGEAAAVERSRIHRIEVELLGLARDPDPGWVDPGDPNPLTKPFHKFELASNIQPRNIGMVGIKDVDDSLDDF